MIEEITCSECGKKYSRNLESCPNCGCPIIYSRDIERR